MMLDVSGNLIRGPHVEHTTSEGCDASESPRVARDGAAKGAGLCVLGIGGVERIELGPGEVCEAIVVGEGTGSAEPGERCAESTAGGGGDGVDETASGTNGADETS
jgi:hypothetical protein